MNLSLVCQIVGRELILYDSFEGLPAAVDGDKFGVVESAGGLRGSLDVVRDREGLRRVGCRGGYRVRRTDDRGSPRRGDSGAHPRQDPRVACR